jgi:hypothetical protein
MSTTLTLFSRRLFRFTRPAFSLSGVRNGLTRSQRRRAWIDLVSSSPHLQHDLGLIDTLPQKHTR